MKVLDVQRNIYRNILIEKLKEAMEWTGESVMKVSEQCGISYRTIYRFLRRETHVYDMSLLLYIKENLGDNDFATLCELYVLMLDNKIDKDKIVFNNSLSAYIEGSEN
ncbi:MAG: helix-turn-helix domain-containing protein [Lachnospiraceae bacterium]|nr:helix-turn-helix domain-containing protein [Lachnospiraceae bacterium]